MAVKKARRLCMQSIRLQEWCIVHENQNHCYLLKAIKYKIKTSISTSTHGVYMAEIVCLVAIKDEMVSLF